MTGTRADKNIRSLQMGNTEMTPLQVKTILVIFGEPDILKNHSADSVSEICR